MAQTPLKHCSPYHPRSSHGKVLSLTEEVEFPSQSGEQQSFQPQWTDCTCSLPRHQLSLSGEGMQGARGGGFGTHFTDDILARREVHPKPKDIRATIHDRDLQQSALGRHPSSLKWQTGSAGASCGTWQWTLVSRVTEGCNVLAGQSAVTAVETIPAPVAMLLLSAQHSSSTFWTATVPNSSWITTSPKRA